MSELKPCPFCGGEAVSNSKATDRINCSSMGCYQSEAWREYGMTVGNWNTRPIEDALRARAEKAEMLLQLILDCVDYTSGNCRLTEMVGAVLPKEILSRAKGVG